MPTIFIFFGLRFMFYSNEHTPIHIHVVKESGKSKQYAKFTIDPVQLVYNYGLKPSELKMAEAIIEENKETIAEHWNNYFNNGNN